MTPSLTRGILGIALLGTLVAVYFAPEPPDAGVAPIARSGTTNPSTAPASKAVVTPGSRRSNTAGDVEVLTILPRTPLDESRTVFQTHQRLASVKEVPTTSDQATVVTPPPPQAPPLPFKVLGRYVEDGRTKIFLQHNNENMVVQVGDSIADLYHVENLNGGVLTLLYVPLKQEQTLDVGADN